MPSKPAIETRQFDALATALLPAVVQAARLQMTYFAAGVPIERKADKSPVTIADRESEDILIAALTRIAPGIPVIGEETMAAGLAPAAANRFFLVDALDGTRLFIQGKPEFSINVALVDHGRPVFGLIYSPPQRRLFVTRSDGASYQATAADEATAGDFARQAFTRLQTRVPDRARLTAFNSRSAGGASSRILQELGVHDARPMGSSLKFCLVAAGEGDLYARIGDTNEWDTAAGQAILEAAGGSVTGLDNVPLSYGHAARGYLNPHFVAWGRQPLLSADDLARLTKKGA